MQASIQLPTAVQQAALVKAGQDRYSQERGLGINTIDFKVTLRESSGVFVIEITMKTKGGPVRHVHYDQDEWWYVVKGQFVIEIRG
jgi:mannose-6-phosphate isomerase-like protein (cupin superfamily)